MTLRKGKKLSITIQEHMAIDVCPGPIRPIRTISAYFPRLSPTSEPLSPKPTGSPLVLSPGGAASGMGGGGRGGLLTPLLPGAMGGGGSLSLQSSMDTSVEINSSDSDDCTALGTLEFDLRYERASSQLHCTILRAKGLKPMDFNGLADPYVKLHLLPGACKANKLKTKIVRNTLNPVWNEMLTYVGITEEDMHRKTLRCVCVCVCVRACVRAYIHFSEAKERVKPSALFLFQPLPPLLFSSLFKQWENEQLHSLEERGRVLLSLQFLPPLDEGDGGGGGRRGEGLCVGVQRCAHLAAMDVNGFSDPYVKTYLKPDTQKKSKHKTAVIKKTLNPEFNEEFFYEISMSELSNKTLEVTVWDYDLGRSNDFIGGVCLSCHSQGDPLRHWMDCLKNKGQRVERWHILTNELPRSVSHE
ncbi:LOW QUALITY PROTEIN: double C2-like domain-containing protein alpha [Salvelinus alpinus]